MTTTVAYDADAITALEGLEHVRLRPGMYIASRGSRGFHHCLWEVVDNCVDEAMGGYCDKITVILLPDGSVSVEDNGRGIPVEPQRSGIYKGMSTLQMVLTKLNAGGKFDKKGYAYSGGLHGVGVSVVNALSSWVRVTVTRDGEQHEMHFGLTDVIEDGVSRLVPGHVTKPVTKLRNVGAEVHGTKVHFLLDPDMFTSTEWNIETIRRRLSQTSFLNPGITCVLIDSRLGEGTPETFCHPGGLTEFASYQAAQRCDGMYQELLGDGIEAAEPSDDAPERPTPLLAEPILLQGSSDEVGEWQACLTWVPDRVFWLNSFVNGIETPDGGTHVDAVTRSITAIMNNYCRQDHVGLLNGRDFNLDGSDIQMGLNLIVTAKVLDPQFEGQTKGRLGNDEVGSMVRSGFKEQLLYWLEDHPAEARVVLDRAIQEMRTRRKIEDLAAKERQAQEPRGIAARSQPLPVKLADCETKHRAEAELFIVEGDSAAGPAKTTRNRATQAVLPIRGKGLNVERASAEQISRNAEVQGIIAALAAGSEDMFDLSACRYGKIIIFTDADDDGRHIECLLMTMFIRLMRPLVEAGRLYVARPPLYASEIKGKKLYVHTLAERDALDVQYGGRLTWTRFKGLGEMENADLFETCIDPKTRRVAQITMEDALLADATVEALMGADSAAKWAALADLELDLEEVTSA